MNVQWRKSAARELAVAERTKTLTDSVVERDSPT